MRAVERIGLALFAEPAAGVFVWERFPHIVDSLALAEASERAGIMLAGGRVFRPHLERSPWLRFNVAVYEDTRAALAAAPGPIRRRNAARGDGGNSR